MSTVKVQGNASGTGSITLASPNTNSNRTINLPDVDGSFVTADGSGNVGLGVTPSAWGSGGNLDGTNGFTWSAYDASIGNGYYYNGGYKYKSTGISVSKYSPYNGSHQWFTAPSGTAGNAISFTQAMTLDASGKLLVGTTTGASGASVQASFINSSGGGIQVGYPTAGGGALVGNSGGGIQFYGYAGAQGSEGYSERARIDSSGNLLVGTTTQDSGAKFTLYHAGQVGQSYVSTGTGTAGVVYFKNGNGVVGQISTSGSTTTYATSSDYRLKENIAPMTGALSVVAQLKPVTYTWKADGVAGQGFIAHELQEVVPDCVTGEKDAVDDNGNPIYQGIDTSFLVATLTAAIQELKADLDATKAELAALKGATQ